MRNLRLKLIAGLFSMSTIICAMATAQTPRLKDPLRVVNRKLHIDKKSGTIHLNEVDGAGLAWITGKEFTTGTIEFDIKGKDTLQSSFVGIAFHGLDNHTYECVYFRPFNFLATDPIKKSHSVQYIALPGYDWPTLRDNFPNKYEQPIPSYIDPNGWFHVKIKVSADRVSVYVNGNHRAALEVQPLTHTSGKMIGYWVGYGSGGYWKNLKITKAR